MPGTLQMEGVQLRIDFSFASVAPGQIPPISYATQKLLRVDNNTGFTRLLPHATCADHYIKSEAHFVGRRLFSAAVHRKIRSPTKTSTLILSSTTTGGRPARVIRYCLSPPGDCPYGPCNGSLAAPLPSAMLHSSFGSRLAVARFVPPVACLLLPLAEQRTEEAFAGASFTSVQRSAAFCTEPGQSGLAPFFASPHYNARAFSGGLLT